MDSEGLKRILETVKQKKVVFIALGVLLFVFIIVIVLSPNSQSPTPTEQIAMIPSVTNSNSISSGANGGNVSVKSNLPKWSTLDDKTFSIQYSPDWTAVSGGVAGGGEVVIIKPKNLPDGINYPQFIVQTEPAVQGTIDQKAEIMRSLGLIRSDLIIFGQKARKLSGTIPFKNVAGRKVSEPIQETNILFSHEGKIYTIQYAYEGGEVNPDLETYFGGLIEGIKLK